jgi:3-hydroxyacyl-[acyl-carrier-protein] dehydratase
LREYIAQRDEVEQLDRIIWVNDEVTLAVASRTVRDDEWWVSGHIPGNPILPGVLMIESAAQLSSFMYESKLRKRNEPGRGFLGFAGIDKTRFRMTVAPGDEIILVLKERKFAPRRLIAAVQGLVNGDIAFETTIIGMPIGHLSGPVSADR